ncbi:ankyrin repeat-containing domain protein [Xylariaceae sp. FL1019]|nr:ankyrin repeat-containing domain protein [Xylariaceae sp. FL1019]
MAITITTEERGILFAEAQGGNANRLAHQLQLIANREGCTLEDVLALTKNSDRSTILHVSAEYGRVGILDYYFTLFVFRPALRKGLLSEKNVMLDAPIHIATRKREHNFVTALINEGVDVNLPGPFGFTPLHIAAHDGNTTLVEDLLAIPNINIDAQSMSKETALHLVAHNDDLDTTRVLLDNRASAQVRNASDCTPGQVTRSIPNSRVRAYMIQRGLSC